MTWTYSDLTALTGAASAATGASSYVFAAHDTQHIDYAAVGHIHELWHDSSGWHYIDLTATVSGTPTISPSRTNAPTGYVFAAQGTQHVVFVADQGATAGHIHEIYRNSTGWHHHDLTSAASAPAAIPSQPAAYAFEEQQTQHVIYIGPDCHVHELWWDNDGWHRHDLTAATGAPMATQRIPPVGYAMPGRFTQHVHFVSEAGRLVELLWSDGTWYSNDLITWTGGPLADFSSIAAYADPLDHTQHLAYVGADGSVHELWADGNGWWRHASIGAEAGVTGGALGNLLCAYVFPFDGTRHVTYVGGDGHVKELWQSSNGWHANDLTAASGAPLADFAPVTAYVTSDMQHVDFIQIDGLHIYELRWQHRPLPIIDVPLVAVNPNE